MRGPFLGLCLLAGAGVLVAAPAAATTGTTRATAVPASAGTVSVAGSAATGGIPLNVRAAPSAGSARRGTIRNGSRITLICRVTGQQIRGYVRSTNQWDLVSTGSYVSDAYVRRSATPAVCPAPGTPAPGTPAPRASSGWLAPVVAVVGDGFRIPARPTHQGVDLIAARNTAIRAAAAGTVITVVCNASTNNCNVDGGPTVLGCGWYVEVLHPGSLITRYCHMIRRPSVQVGQQVTAGQTLGFVGSSGHSSGPHLHFEVHAGNPPATNGNAVDPVAFMRARSATLGAAR